MRSLLPAALRMSAGVIVWAVHFAVLYGFTALACARGLAAAVPWVTGGATAAAALAIGFVLFARAGDFEAWLARALGAAALVAIAFEAVPLFLVPACE